MQPLTSCSLRQWFISFIITDLRIDRDSLSDKERIIYSSYLFGCRSITSLQVYIAIDMLKLKVIHHHHHHRHYYQAQGFVIQIDKQMLLFGCYDDIPDTLIDRQLLFSNKQKNSAIINRFFFGRLIKIK